MRRRSDLVHHSLPVYVDVRSCIDDPADRYQMHAQGLDEGISYMWKSALTHHGSCAALSSIKLSSLCLRILP